MEVKFVDNSPEVLERLKKAVRRGLEAAGMTATTYAKKNTPVDTGRLRNSITYAIYKNDAYIGTNVSYAPYVELGARGRPGVHMLREAAVAHGGEYKQLMEDSIKNA